MPEWLNSWKIWAIATTLVLCSILGILLLAPGKDRDSTESNQNIAKEQKQTDKLIATFSRMTKDHQQLPVDVFRQITSFRKETSGNGQPLVALTPGDLQWGPKPEFSPVKDCVEVVQVIVEMGDAAIPLLVDALKNRDTPIVIPQNCAWGTNNLNRRMGLDTGLVKLEGMEVQLKTQVGKERRVVFDHTEAAPRSWIGLTLECLGANALPSVEKLRWDEDARVQFDCMRILQRSGRNEVAKEPVPNQAIASLVKGLSYPEADVEKYSATTLQNVTSERIPLNLIPELLNALKRSGQTETHAVINRYFTDRGRETVPELVKILEVDDPAIRNEAVMVLGRLGNEAIDAVPDLARILTDSGTVFARRRELEKTRGGGPEVFDALTKNAVEYLVLEHTVESLRKVQPPPADVIPAMQTFLAAVEAGGSFEELSQRLRDAEFGCLNLLANYWISDVDAAKAAGLQVDRLVSDLIDYREPHPMALNRPDGAAKADIHREEVIRLLAGIGAPTVPHLITALKDPSRQQFAVTVLRRIGPRVDGVVSALVQALRDAVSAGRSPENFGSRNHREEIVAALGEMGPAATEAIPTLIAQMADLELETKQALEKIGPPPLGKLQEIFKSDGVQNREQHKYALEAISHLGAKAAPAVPQIIEATKSSTDSLNEERYKALLRIGPKVEGVMDFLISEIRGTQLLEKLSFSLDQAAVPAVLALAKNDDDTIRESAFRAISDMASFGEVPAEAIPELCGMLNPDNVDNRIQIANILAKIGTVGLPALEKQIKTESDEKKQQILKNIVKNIRTGQVR